MPIIPTWTPLPAASLNSRSHCRGSTPLLGPEPLESDEATTVGLTCLTSPISKYIDMSKNLCISLRSECICLNGRNDSSL
jgi:hypothetical protein